MPQSTLTTRPTSNAWDDLQQAILQERYDDLPDRFTAMEFAQFSAEPIELIRETIKSGEVVAVRDDGQLFVPKADNEALVRYRLTEDSRACVPPRSETPDGHVLTTELSVDAIRLVAHLAERGDTSVRVIIERALRSWAKSLDHSHREPADAGA